MPKAYYDVTILQHTPCSTVRPIAQEFCFFVTVIVTDIIHTYWGNRVIAAVPVKQA